jgi:LytR cell envelope-related transcriptional attenuator
VIDAGNAAGASTTEDVLTQAGFDVSPGVVAAAPPQGLRHTAIAYAPGQEAYAKVAATYFPGLKLVETKGLASPVAIVVFRGYEPSDQPSGGASEGPSAAQCPADSP